MSRMSPRAAAAALGLALLLGLHAGAATAALAIEANAELTNFGLYYASKETVTVKGKDMTRYCFGLTKAALRGLQGKACDPANSPCCSTGANDGPQSLVSVVIPISASCTAGGAASTFKKTFWSIGDAKVASPSGKATVKGTASAAFTVKLPGPSKMKWEADAKLCVNLMADAANPCPTIEKMCDTSSCNFIMKTKNFKVKEEGKTTLSYCKIAGNLPLSCDYGKGAPDKGYSCEACTPGFTTDTTVTAPPLPRCINPAACSPACEHGGKCVGVNTCDCTGTSYTGATCGTATGSGCSLGCKNGGKCEGATCNCKGTGYNGDQCQNKLTCNFDCKHGGVCSETGCDCDGTGYSGKSCSGATTADGTGAVFQMTLKGITVDPSNTDAAKDLFKTLALNALPFNNYPPEQINVELIPIYGRRRHLMGTILGYIIKFTLTESAFIPVNQISSVLEAPSFLSGLVQDIVLVAMSTDGSGNSTILSTTEGTPPVACQSDSSSGDCAAGSAPVPMEKMSDECHQRGKYDNATLTCACMPGYLGAHCDWQVATAVNYLGPDLKQNGSLPTADSSACASACSGNPKCKMWVWSLSSKVCHLKQTIYWRTLPDQYVDAGLPAGRLVCLPACFHGDCVAVNATSNTCSCSTGWVDDLAKPNEPKCTIPVCTPPCANGKCVEPDTCDCANTGFTGATCSEDINECANNPCHKDATCSNTPGSFTCTCGSGLSGNGFTCSTCTGFVNYYANYTCTACPAGASPDPSYRYRCICGSGQEWSEQQATCVTACNGYRDSSNGGACTACPSGSDPYKPSQDRCSCRTNPAPTVWSTIKHSCLSACTGDHYYNANDDCVTCPTGSTPSYSTFSHECGCPSRSHWVMSASKCSDICTANQFWNRTGTNCIACPLGGTSSSGSTCDCPSAAYRWTPDPDGGGHCLGPAAADEYFLDAYVYGQYTLTKCPDGLNATDAHNGCDCGPDARWFMYPTPGCRPCTGNNFWEAGQDCKPCPAGSTAYSPVKDRCNCGAGIPWVWTPSNRGSCGTPCTSGQYLRTLYGPDTCLACPPDTTLGSTTPISDKCACAGNGTFSAWDGACWAPCVAGTDVYVKVYANVFADRKCLPCPGNSTGQTTYWGPDQQGPGSSCTCPAGQRWTYYQSKCIPLCPAAANTYTDVPTDLCKACPAHGTQSNSEAYECNCEAGYYWHFGLRTCRANCGANQFSDSSTGACRDCPQGSSGLTSQNGGTTMSCSCPSGQFFDNYYGICRS